MEAEDTRAKHFPHILHGVFPMLSAALFVSMGYINPAKWAACIDSGARFGGDLAVFLFLFNLVACLCQYLSVHIGVVSKRNLAQICYVEYDTLNCIFLGIQAEVSIIMSDLSMLIGIANGLHMMLSLDLFSAVTLAALDAILYPFFSILLWNSKAIGLLVRLAVLTLVCYVLVMLIGLPENSVSSISVPSKLVGENVYALMSLLGANFMPHNFYLHSSLVQRFQGSSGETRARLAYDKFFSIFAIFSGIFLVNFVLMNSAANMFYNSGLVLPTFQDAMSLMEQSLWSLMWPLSFFLFISSSHISGLSWDICGEGRQTILYDFFGIDIPCWLHRATVRIFVIIPALYSLWYSGAEGMYQMLILTQIVVALLLPASVVALYRIASSRALMGANKISSAMEFFMMMSFMAMIGLQLIFLWELVFGDSAWLGYMRWNMGTDSITSPYFILIFSGCASLCFTCRLYVTPLRSADRRSNAQQRRRGRSQRVHGSMTNRQENNMVGSLTENAHSDATAPNYCADLQEPIMETHPKRYLTPIEEVSTAAESCDSPIGSLALPTVMPESVPVQGVIEDWSGSQFVTPSQSKVEAADMVIRTLRVDGEPATKYGEEGQTQEPEEASKEVSQVAPALAPCVTNHSSRLNEGGSDAGALSRLSGLGRAARRQLAAVLDEFWGQLYDYHGQLTKAAKAKKLDLSFGADSNSNPPSPAKADSVGEDFGSHLQSIGASRSDSLMNSNLNDASVQQRLPSTIGSACRLQNPFPPLCSDKMKVMDAYIQSSGDSPLDNGERRYSSLRLPPSSVVMNYQPDTFNRTAKDGRREYPSMGMYKSREPFASSLSPKPTNGYSSVQSAGFQQNLPASRNCMVQSDGSNYELFSPTLAENVANKDDSKKYLNLPEILVSDLPLREVYLHDKYTPWGNPNTSNGFTTPGSPLYANLASRVASPASRSVSGLDDGSLWSKQPYEFGVTNKTSLGGATCDREKSLDMVVSVDSEVKLLRSLRDCILKLLKLEGSDWLFRQTDCVDEDLVDRVAMRERSIYEAELKDTKPANANNSQDSAGAAKGNVKDAVFSVPHCGKGCVWKPDLIVSFGVWCIHRILELSLTENRPELWGKYTYVLNRLQGVIDPAFIKQRSPMQPCFCLQISTEALEPPARPPNKKLTTAPILLDMIKDIEISICSKKGRAGTAAGDVAFPKGKENLASVLKRYKRRFSNKPVGSRK